MMEDEERLILYHCKKRMEEETLHEKDTLVKTDIPVEDTLMEKGTLIEKITFEEKDALKGKDTPQDASLIEIDTRKTNRIQMIKQISLAEETSPVETDALLVAETSMEVPSSNGETRVQHKTLLVAETLLKEGSLSEEETSQKPKFTVGDMLWAKIGRYPYWPCMVSYDPNKGVYAMLSKTKVRKEYIYHVQYFGKKVQHGWTKPGNIFPYEGEHKWYQEQTHGDVLTAKSTKKHLLSKYYVPSFCEQLWNAAVKEAETALPYQPLERFELFVFKYEIKQSVLNGHDSLKRPANFESSIQDKRMKKDCALKVCKLCEEADANVRCDDCSRYFHIGCLGLISKPTNFMCFMCDRGLHQCVVCQKMEVSLTKCSKCRNFFHNKCLEGYPCANIGKNICPSHICLTCYNENPRNRSSKVSGSFTRCFCCPNVFHSRENCLPVGSEKLTSSVIKCPDHYLGKMKISPQPSLNILYCFICSEGGELLCCDACPRAYHAQCLNIDVPSGDFFCSDCSKRKYLYAGMIIWAKTGIYRWWPAEIVAEDDLPLNVKNLRQYDGEFPIIYLGTNEYFWTHRGRVMPYPDYCPKVVVNKNIPLSSVFKMAVDEASEAYNVYLENALTAQIFSSTPDFYKHIRVNKPVPPAQISVHDSKSLFPCSCDPSARNPCGDDTCLNRSMLMECHPDVCTAKDLCQNQKFQKRQYLSVKVTKTKGRGWGLESREYIKKGSFVIEYVGEIITHEEYRRRAEEMKENKIKNYYFLYLDARRMIDAGPKGNLARFINHSCDPNCEMVKWSVNGDARIGIFALTNILPGEELTFHYQSDSFEFHQTCLCGATNCQGFVGKNAKNRKKK